MEIINDTSEEVKSSESIPDISSISWAVGLGCEDMVGKEEGDCTWTGQPGSQEERVLR